MIHVLAIAVGVFAASPLLAQSAPDNGSRTDRSGTQQQPIVGGTGIPPEARGHATSDVPMGTHGQPTKPERAESGDRKKSRK